MKQEICIAAFYKFAPFPDYRTWREPLLLICRAAGIRGTILLAEEGINATIAGERAGIDSVLNFLRSDPRFDDMMVKVSFHSAIPFQRLKVRLKREIVALKARDVNPLAQVGQYVEPEHWNNLITQDDVVLIDARNKYEVALGSFSGALDPQTESFPRAAALFQRNNDAGAAQASRHVLHRRHSLRKGHRLFVAARLRAGLSPAWRYTELP